jgi:hypothetical protein
MGLTLLSIVCKVGRTRSSEKSTDDESNIKFKKNEHLGKALELIFLGIGNIIEGLSSHFNFFVMQLRILHLIIF